MKRNGIATLVLAAAVFWVTNASAIGFGVGVIVPTGDLLGDAYEVGYGAHLVLDYPVTPLASIYADLGWQSLQAKSVDVPALELKDLSVGNICAGGKFGLGTFFLGGEIGYYMASEGVKDEVGLAPLLGFGLGPVEISGRYKFIDELNWWDIRAGISF